MFVCIQSEHGRSSFLGAHVSPQPSKYIYMDTYIYVCIFFYIRNSSTSHIIMYEQKEISMWKYQTPLGCCSHPAPHIRKFLFPFIPTHFPQHLAIQHFFTFSFTNRKKETKKTTNPYNPLQNSSSGGNAAHNFHTYSHMSTAVFKLVFTTMYIHMYIHVYRSVHMYVCAYVRTSFTYFTAFDFIVLLSFIRAVGSYIYTHTCKHLHAGAR